MMIDWQIRFGDLLVVASFLGGGIIYAFRTGRFTETVSTMRRDIDTVMLAMQTMAVTLSKIAVQEERLDSQAERMNILHRDLQDIRRAGDVNRGLDGEYPQGHPHRKP